MLLLVWGVVDGAGPTAGPRPGARSLIAGAVLLGRVRGLAAPATHADAAAAPVPLARLQPGQRRHADVLAPARSARCSCSPSSSRWCRASARCEAGLRTLPWTMAPMVVAPLAGIFADRLGARNLIVAGQIFLAAGLLWIALRHRDRRQLQRPRRRVPAGRRRHGPDTSRRSARWRWAACRPGADGRGLGHQQHHPRARRGRRRRRAGLGLQPRTAATSTRSPSWTAWCPR